MDIWLITHAENFAYGVVLSQAAWALARKSLPGSQTAEASMGGTGVCPKAMVASAISATSTSGLCIRPPLLPDGDWSLAKDAAHREVKRSDPVTRLEQSFPNSPWKETYCCGVPWARMQL